MIRSTLIFVLLALLFTTCTKEVRENVKISAKSADETYIREVIENYTAAYNAGDIESAIEFIDINYRGMTADSLDIFGQEGIHDDLLQYRRQYPEGKWETKIEEITIGDGYAYVLCSSSFLMPHPIEQKFSPIYSERSVRILKKEKPRGWKIYRYLAAPTFTYD
ncbi:MAG: nuclear transport factor 2 family protein [Bacteroidota bacterium]